MKNEVYFHWELLTYSLEDRIVELITITGNNNGKQEEREDKVSNLFPDLKECDDALMSSRFEK